MFDENELRNEIYKFISNSISLEERNMLNLKEEQIIPTLNLFRNIKWQLTASYMLESHECNEINEEISWDNVKDKEQINILFLGILCVRNGIDFAITKENINITWHISLIEKDLVKEYQL